MTSAAHGEIAIHREGVQRMGFFTDTTVCIGCKSCEVACKQWNDLPADGFQFRKGGSYDHTGSLGAATWRHVRFVERLAPSPEARAEAEAALAAGKAGHLPSIPAATGSLPSPEELGGAGGGVRPEEVPDLVQWAQEKDGVPVVGEGDVDVGSAVAAMDRWLFMSDVCKHCTNAGCLDACPTGAIIRTEFQSVVIQPDVCNGCGYCIPSCPFGVPNRDPYDGRAAKCTLCYDRLEDGLEPACAKACPTDAIQFGPYDELVETAKGRVIALHDRGIESAYLYGAADQPGEQLAGGLGAFFLLTEPPERFGLPAHADSPIQANAPIATVAGLAAAAAAMLGTAASFALARRRARR
jgi:formate dehydrogenase iron-sulfur subunit